MVRPATQSVMVVDDHVSLAEMVGHYIRELPGFEVTSQVSNIQEAKEQVLLYQPDLVILDLILEQGVSGLRLIDELAKTCPKVRYLIFSGNLTVANVRQALSAGVVVIVDKGAPLVELKKALQSAALDRPYYSPAASEYVRQVVMERRSGHSSSVELTPRERSVLTMLAEGMSSKEIAERLGLSAHTIVNHRTNLMRKTGLHRVAQLARLAAELGLVTRSAP